VGLRAFHLLFISLSVLLAAFIVAWATGQYRVDHQPIDLLFGIAGVVAGAVMVVYGTAFRRKTRNLQ